MDLEGRSPILRTQEANFGSYLADLFRRYISDQDVFVQKYGKPQIGMLNSGIIRAPINVSEQAARAMLRPAHPALAAGPPQAHGRTSHRPPAPRAAAWRWAL